MKQLLLNYFGIISNKIHVDRIYNEDSVSYRLHINSAEDISLFNNAIGFLSNRKKSMLANYNKISDNSVTFKRNYVPHLSKTLNFGCLCSSY